MVAGCKRIPIQMLFEYPHLGIVDANARRVNQLVKVLVFPSLCPVKVFFGETLLFTLLAFFISEGRRYGLNRPGF